MAKDRQRQNAAMDYAQAEPGAARGRPEVNNQSGAPSGSSTLWAAWRQGLKDLQNAVLGAWGGTHEEPGSIANPTTQVITNDMGNFHGYNPTYDEARAQAQERRRESPGMSR
jgi:hypothetical protein